MERAARYERQRQYRKLIALAKQVEAATHRFRLSATTIRRCAELIRKEDRPCLVAVRYARSAEADEK